MKGSEKNKTQLCLIILLTYAYFTTNVSVTKSFKFIAQFLKFIRTFFIPKNAHKTEAQKVNLFLQILRFIGSKYNTNQKFQTDFLVNLKIQQIIFLSNLWIAKIC